MGRPIAELLEELALTPDGVRQTIPFSPEMAACQNRILNPGLTLAEKADALRDDWLSCDVYPCLFGRNAAKKGWISTVVLDERDLFRSDEYIQELIMAARHDWQRRALKGEQHALIILASSPILANAAPNSTLLELTVRLCEAYIRKPAEPNRVYRDEVFIHLDEQQGPIGWQVGIDTFSAAGDGRWWHDHRIPGGIALSMNSVGHMAYKLLHEAAERIPQLHEHIRSKQPEKLLRWALPTAMRTILQAQQKSSRPGTRLAPGEAARCPWKSPVTSSIPTAFQPLVPYSADYYYGWYHTDHTVRAEFYHERTDHPDTSSELELDFKYLHHSDDEDYLVMSLGEEVLTILEGE